MILKASSAEDKSSRWYVVPSKFVHDWLAYVDAKKKEKKEEEEAETKGGGKLHAEEDEEPEIQPRPEKLDNSPLLEADETTKLWRVKLNIRKANDKYPGDYRLINKQTYEAFCDLYPGSGPTIYVDDYHKDNFREWYIDQSAILEAQGAVLSGPEMQKNTFRSLSVATVLSQRATGDNIFDEFFTATGNFFESLAKDIGQLLFVEVGEGQKQEAQVAQRSDYNSMEAEK